MPGRGDPDRQDPRPAGERGVRVGCRLLARGGCARVLELSGCVGHGAGGSAGHGADAHEAHRPREGLTQLDDLAVLREELLEGSARPVVHVAGRVAQRLPVGAAAHVRRAPQRLARHRHEDPALRRSAASRRACPRDPARARAPRSPSPCRTRSRRTACSRPSSTWYSRFGARAALPLLVQQRVVEVDADDAPVAEALGPLVGEHALAAADVEDRGRRRRCPRARRGCGGSPSSAGGRPGSSSRTCRTCCR